MNEARERQLEILTKGLNVEEKGVELYMKYLEDKEFWKLMSKDSAEIIKANLKILAVESQRHVSLVEKMIELFKNLPVYA